MCGIIGLVGKQVDNDKLIVALDHLDYRGPDAKDSWVSPAKRCALGHCRLSIIDLSNAGIQPMSDSRGRYQIIFNGEVYNYLELKTEIGKGYNFKSGTDTEVVLAAYQKWGQKCLDKFVGMFAFAIWDELEQSLFVARDRFGVKPLYYASLPTGELALASEIKALHFLGLPRESNPVTWSTYLTYGLYDHGQETFWKDVKKLLPGHAMYWQNGNLRLWKWYDLPERVGLEFDLRGDEEVSNEYEALMEESIRFRFRSDVPVGINLSGGLDSSILLGLVHRIQGLDSKASAFTYITGDSNYDELPWVRQVLAKTEHPHHVCLLDHREVPDFASRVQWHQDEPFGGLPTLAYSKIFEEARKQGVIVLLDGQGLDEQWAGYDYYAKALNKEMSFSRPALGPVQGSKTSSVRPGCVIKEFRDIAEPFIPPSPFPDGLRNLQYHDFCYTKIPRSLRFADRMSMMSSTELRDPFFDHRLVELAFRQPPERKIQGSTHKWLLRKIARDLLPQGVVNAPKRPVQTPQREWLRTVLRTWAKECIEDALSSQGQIWLDSKAVRNQEEIYHQGRSDNSFYIWQWINLGLLSRVQLKEPVGRYT